MISAEPRRAKKQSLKATHPGYPNVVYFFAYQDEISCNEPLSRIKGISLLLPSIVLFLKMESQNRLPGLSSRSKWATKKAMQ